jgi:hypothetical protein
VVVFFANEGFSRYRRPFGANLNLVVQLVMGVALAIAAVLAKQMRYRAHAVSRRCRASRRRRLPEKRKNPYHGSTERHRSHCQVTSREPNTKQSGIVKSLVLSQKRFRQAKARSAQKKYFCPGIKACSSSLGVNSRRAALAIFRPKLLACIAIVDGNMTRS